jgi:E2/UBC family protein E
MHERVLREIETIRSKCPALQHGEYLEWVLIPDYPLPAGRYERDQTRLLFIIPPGYPNTAPDSFFVDIHLKLKGGGSPPAFNPGANSSAGPAPVGGDWAWFSWHPQSWRPAAAIEGGDNLMTFLRGVNMCLRGEEAA